MCVYGVGVGWGCLGFCIKVMKMASRFEDLIKERRQLEECKEMKDEEILQMIIQRYNNYKANSALKKWQISPDQQSAISGIIWGMCPTARLLVKQHLDFNKYDESGYWDSWVYLFEKH